MEKITDKTALRILFTLCVTIMFAPIFFAAFISCEKYNTVIIQQEVIDTIILDPKTAPSFSRSGDGYYDIFMLGSNYKGQAGLSLFLQDKVLSRASFMYWFQTFEPQYRLDTNKIRIHYANIKQNLNCSGGGLNEGVACDFDKIKRAIIDLAGGQFTVDKIGILGNGQGSGGGGQGYFFTGLGNHMSSIYCTFPRAAFDGIMWHEYLHEYDINHIDTVWNKAAGVYTTNGGCGIWNAPILPHHQRLIYNHYLSITN